MNRPAEAPQLSGALPPMPPQPISTDVLKEKYRKELAAAKEKVRGPLLFSMENPIPQLNFYAKQALDRPSDILDHSQVIAKIMSVEAIQVQKIAQELLVQDKLNLAVVGQLKPGQESQLLKLLHV
mgnify:CR=1 FL=1